MGPGKVLRVNRGCQRVQALDQRWSRRVQEFVADAIHPPVPDRAQFTPLTAIDDLLQWYTIPGATPRSDDDLGIALAHVFAGGPLARFAHELASSRFHQLGHPGLRRDHGIA